MFVSERGKVCGFISQRKLYFHALTENGTLQGGGVLRVMQISSAKVIQSAQSPLCITRSDSYNGFLLEG